MAQLTEDSYGQRSYNACAATSLNAVSHPHGYDMSTLKSWRQVVTPHADIRQGRFDASVFAADLGEGSCRAWPCRLSRLPIFFGKTFLTRTSVRHAQGGHAGRLAESGKAEPVIQLQTPFGGGKTHTLLSLYHLLKSPKEVGRLPAIQGAARRHRPEGRADRQASHCLVGTALNVH